MEPSIPLDSRGRRRLTPQAREAFRHELIGIARDIFLNEGYMAVTIRRITAGAGVTPMTFYWYFDNKDALLTVIWDEIIQESADHCRRAAARQNAPMEQVVTYFLTFLDYWLQHRDYFRFIFLNESPNVDFVNLRTQLFNQSGVSRHFQDYTEMARPLFVERPNREELADKLRTLSMYKAFGFLHFAIGVYGYGEEEARRHRDLVEHEFRHCLARWCQTGA
jgi:AcrR family transcriptional regulator